MHFFGLIYPDLILAILSLQPKREVVIPSNTVAPCLCFQVADIFMYKKRKSQYLCGDQKQVFVFRFGGKERGYGENTALSKTNKVKEYLQRLGQGQDKAA